MSMPAPSIEVLKKLEPLGALSPDSLREISRMCYVERVSRNLDPFRLKGLQGQAVYLVKGELKLDYPDASSEILVGGTEAAVRSLDKRKPALTGAKAAGQIDADADIESLALFMTANGLGTLVMLKSGASAEDIRRQLGTALSFIERTE